MYSAYTQTDGRSKIWTKFSVYMSERGASSLDVWCRFFIIAGANQN